MGLPILVRISPRLRLATLLGSVAIVSLGVATYPHNHQSGLALGGFGLLIAIVALLPSRLLRPERLTVSETGLSGPMLQGTTIPWSHIESAWVRHILWQPFLCLGLRNSQPYGKIGERRQLWFLTSRTRTRLFGDLTLDFFGLTPSAHAVATAVHDHLVSLGP
jgi:hypothetical protein